MFGGVRHEELDFEMDSLPFHENLPCERQVLDFRYILQLREGVARYSEAVLRPRSPQGLMERT